MAKSDPGRPSPANLRRETNSNARGPRRPAAHGLAAHAEDVGLPRLTQAVDPQMDGLRTPASPDIRNTAATFALTAGDGNGRDKLLRARLEEI